MASHWFSTFEVQKLLANKRVVIIGDSVQRGVYKDLVCLLKANQLLKLKDLRAKGEDSFEGDQLLEGGCKAGLKSTQYKEVRKFSIGSTVVMFYFVTRCYGEYVKSIIATFATEPPDVIIMNSCLWDLSRYGKNSNTEFISNINKLLEAIGLVIPYDSRKMFIWNATLPVTDNVKTSCVPFDIPQAFRPEKQNVRNANIYVRAQMAAYGDHFIFLDLYQVFYGHLNHRIDDGVHWNDFAHRKMTCLLLTEITKQWNVATEDRNHAPMAANTYSRRTIKASLTSTPSIGGRRSLGFAPNHSRTPYQRPSPRHIGQNQHYGPPRTSHFLSSQVSANFLPHMFFGLPMPRSPVPRHMSLAHIPRQQFPFTLSFPGFNWLFNRACNAPTGRTRRGER